MLALGGLLIWLLLWPLLAIVVGCVAIGKGRSFFGHFLLSMIISPLFGLLVLIALPAIDRSKPTGMKTCRSCGQAYDGTAHWSCPHCKVKAKISARPMKKCPACAEEILAEAIKCRYCGTDLNTTPRLQGPGRLNVAYALDGEPTSATPSMVACKSCGKLVASNSLKCLYCGVVEPVPGG